jgi:glycerol kinase
MSLLVIDVGTSGVRAAMVAPDGSILAEQRQELLPDSPAPGLVEFDAARLAATVLDLAGRVLDSHGPADAVGITDQRASTVVWDRATGEPVGPGLGWQDLRTVGDCLVLQGEGIHVAPNASATKAAHLLDAADPDRSGTCAWARSTPGWRGTLSGGDSTSPTPPTPPSPASCTPTAPGGPPTCSTPCGSPAAMPAIVDTSGPIGAATALAGSPPITAMVGDQQASLVGQGCVAAGLAKITFGTGGMLDLNLGPDRPSFERQGAQGCFPMHRLAADGQLAWGSEAVMLSAGTNVEWLRDDLGIIESAAQSHEVAAACRHRRGRLRARPAGTGRTPLGLRRPRHAAGHHPGHRPGRGGPGRARRASPTAAPTWSRPPRPTPACPSRRCGSTAA